MFAVSQLGRHYAKICRPTAELIVANEFQPIKATTNIDFFSKISRSDSEARKILISQLMSQNFHWQTFYMD